ncbi:hypothetical protein Anapl_13743 [Anas platyrhynchos]|uniref:Uncharacterized protein n=1 Tax=Anas platyrhynchos TaxID=8839 RepID=R0LZM2_ANAPL|nr:hypothetical protein Anapl_13743 [Anas platyrhynchos]
MSWWFALLPPWQRGAWVGLQGHQSCGGDTATRVGLLLQGHAEEMDDQLIRGSVDQLLLKCVVLFRTSMWSKENEGLCRCASSAVLPERRSMRDRARSADRFDCSSKKLVGWRTRPATAFLVVTIAFEGVEKAQHGKCLWTSKFQALRGVSEGQEEVETSKFGTCSFDDVVRLGSRDEKESWEARTLTPCSGTQGAG